MREILFRGKLSTGEWAYGNLSIKPGGKVAIITPDATPIGKYGAVDFETVGQYTGMFDSNGEQIFEGDILDFIWGKSQLRGYVRYLDAAFIIDTKLNGYICDLGLTRHQCMWMINVGNIYDNPDLLDYE